MASTYQVTGFPQQSWARGSLLLASPCVTALATSGWGAEPLGAPRGLCLPRKRKVASKPARPERGKARGRRVCTREAATAAARGGGGGGRAAGRLSASARRPRSAPTQSNHVFTKLSGDFVAGPGFPSSLRARGWGDAWKGPGSGCLLLRAGSRLESAGASLDPGPPRPRGARPLAPVPLRATLWAARAAQRGRGCRERGRGKRAGGRLPGEECGCVCGREGRPAASCFLSVSAGGGGEGWGRAPGHQAS